MEKLKVGALRALRWSEEYTKTDMVYLAKGGIWLTIGQITGSLSGLLLSIAMANLLSQETFGTYKYILSLSGIISGFTLTGMGTAVTRSVAQGYEKSLEDGLKISLRWGVIMTFIALCVGTYYFVQGNYVIGISMLFAGCASPLIGGFSLFSSYLSGKKDFKTETIYNILRNVLPTTVLIITVFLTDNLLWIIGVYFVAHTLFSVYFYRATTQKYAPTGSEDKSMVSYGKHLSFMNLFAKLAEGLDKVLMFHFLGAAQLAIYSFSMTPINQLKGLEKMVSKLSLPKFSERSFSEIKSKLLRKIAITSLVGAVIVVVYILSAPYIYTLLFPQYIESVAYSQVFSLVLLFVPGTFIVQALTAHQKTTALYKIYTIIPVVKIILLSILLPLYGIWGAITSLVLIQAFGLVVILYIFVKSE